MPSFITRHLVASSVALSLAFSAQASLLHLLPESTEIVVSINDLPAMRERSLNNPFVVAWSHPAIVEWTAPMREQMDWLKINESMKEESGKTVDELLAMIDGGIAISLAGLAEGDLQEWAKQPNVLILVEVGANGDQVRDFLEETLKREQEDEDEGDHRMVKRENYGDAEVVEVGNRATDEDGEPKPNIYWSVYDGLFVLSPSRESLLSALDAKRNGGADAPFDQSRHYAQIDRRVGEHDMLAYLNGQSLYRTLSAEMEKQAASQPPNPMGFSPTSILPALGLDRFEMMYLTARFDEQETVNHYGFTHNGSPVGLWNMMPTESGHFPEPSWLPESWHTASSMRFDLANMFTELEQMAAQISPMVIGMWQGIQMQVQQNMGIDLKNGLFNTLGDEIVGAQFFEGDPGIDFSTIPFGQSPQLIAIKLRDATVFRNTLNTALQTALQSLKPFMEVRDYLGQEMMVFTLPNPAIPGSSQTTALAVTDDTLFISMFTVAPLEQVLQAMATPGAGTFWNREDVQSSMSWVPRDAMSYALQDSAALMNQAVKTIGQLAAMQAQMAQAAAEEVMDEEGNLIPGSAAASNPFVDGFNHDAAPDIETLKELFGPIISYGIVDGEGIHVEGRLQHVVK